MAVRHRFAMVMIGVALLGATACSSSNDGSSASGSSDAGHRPRAAQQLDGLSPFGPPASSTIAVDGREWRIVTSAKEAIAGPVDFSFRNDGTEVHEMIVVRTGLPLGRIPVDPTTQRVDEKDSSIEVVDEIPEVEVGDTGTAIIDLEPGTYQIICNLPGHYANGMRTSLVVR